MKILTFEVTNACSRSCVHCLRNREDPPGFLLVDLAEAILSQAKALGLKKVALTGGEVAVYPHLEDLVRLIAAHSFTFNLVTNGCRFGERLLPLLSEPPIKEKLEGVCFSLDGARPETHDALRGEGSFLEVMEAISLCKLTGISLGLKSVITNLNKGELTDMALLGATLGAVQHDFLSTFPTPGSIREGIMLSPKELKLTVQWIMESLAPTVRGKITTDGLLCDDIMFICPSVQGDCTVDFQGNLIFCCTLSHTTMGKGIPTSFGKELLADLREVPLKEGIRRHFHLVGRLVESRLQHMEELAGLSRYPCYWCMKHFGKLEWLKDFPESPWAAGVLDG